MIFENCIFCNSKLQQSNLKNYILCSNKACSYVEYARNWENKQGWIFVIFSFRYNNKNFYIIYNFEDFFMKLYYYDEHGHNHYLLKNNFSMDHLPITPTNCKQKIETLINFY